MSTRTSSSVPVGTWVADAAHSSVQFAVKHMGIATVRGSFTEFEGAVTVGATLADTVSHGSVAVASVSTGEPRRDEHLRSPDFFDAERFPTIDWVVSRVEAVDEDTSRVFGELTMHGVTRDLVLEAVVQGVDTDPWGNERFGLEAVGTLKRSDFDMRFDQALGSGNKLVGDKVSILLDISAVRQA
jgi:polyisoprenoid-binding protein YceI